ARRPRPGPAAPGPGVPAMTVANLPSVEQRAARMPRVRGVPAQTAILPMQHALEAAAAGARLDPAAAVALLEAAPLLELAGAADARRGAVTDPTLATYQIDRNINYTNVCVTDCSFCAFYRHR